METLAGVLFIDAMGRSFINGTVLGISNGFPDKFSAATNFVVSQQCSSGNPATVTGNTGFSGTESVFFVETAAPGIISPGTETLNFTVADELSNEITVKKEKKKTVKQKSSDKEEKKDKKPGTKPGKSKSKKNQKD